MVGNEHCHDAFRCEDPTTRQAVVRWVQLRTPQGRVYPDTGYLPQRYDALQVPGTPLHRPTRGIPPPNAC